MSASMMVLATAGAFVLSHFLLSHPLRRPLVNAMGEKGFLEIIAATHTGLTTEAFAKAVVDWMATARHPRFQRPYTDLVYQPMLELLALLRARQFKTYIVSGGGIEFMRPWTERVYGIPPEQVVGSSGVTRYRLRPDGSPELVKEAKIMFIDDGPGKPEGIIQFIGRRPVFAFGNSDGDQQMLEWTAAGSGARFMGLIHHTDAGREWAYDRKSHIGRLDKAFDEATALLAGDALQALAFEIMVSPETHRDALMRCKLVERLALAAGARGMVGGQMIDMYPALDDEEPLQVMTRMQRLKTGALITLAGEVGALLGGALDSERHAISGYTNDLGLAFQIVDDLLDVEGDPGILGKATAKDVAAGKKNFVSLLGVEGAQDRVRYLAAQAKQHLASFGSRASSLLHTVDFVLNRRH